MIRTFGKMPTSLPDGMLVAVKFPVLVLTNTTTPDGRHLVGDGGGTRNIPMSISAQFVKASGHAGAVLTGAVHEVSFDPDTNIVSGRGFLADTEDGRKHAYAIKTQMMDRNSVGVADIKNVRFIYDEASGEDWIEFGQWNLADTTGVMTPAFAEAYAELEGEIKAAFQGDDFDPMVELVASCTDYDLRIPDPNRDPTPDEMAEIAASFGAVEPYDTFFRPEASKLQKLVFAANGDIYGHLGSWESCHDGVEGRCVRIPRPTDGYASWNKPGVLTEKGIVGTGPICLYGGHGPIESYYDDPKNAWADVRITEGKFGPWLSGRARRGMTDEQYAVARASRISGHWKNGFLKAISSVSAEGFEVPGDDLIAASFAFSMDADGRIEELVASFPPCVDGTPEVEVGLTVATDEIVASVLAQLRADGVIPAADEPAAEGNQLAVMIAGLIDDEDPDLE